MHVAGFCPSTARLNPKAEAEAKAEGRSAKDDPEAGDGRRRHHPNGIGLVRYRANACPLPGATGIVVGRGKVGVGAGLSSVRSETAPSLDAQLAD
ncbi:hypothetical protein BIWAKO_05707 [Bosea sp. BIWAKO-01]|nr:hypothetical protein BIWAKO_05707 [Bosea sp. BIWAKO-01]